LVDTPARSENPPACAAPLRFCLALRGHRLQREHLLPRAQSRRNPPAPGERTARNTGAPRPSVTYTPSTKSM
jgi:hypothetical protein